MEARNEVDIDRLVNYRREYESRLKKAKMSGDGHMVALCPFHADTKQSFSVDLKTGRWYCFTEGRGGNYISFRAELDGTSEEEAFKQILKEYNVYQDPEEKKPKAKPELEAYSLAQYAFEKHLPEDFLRETCRLSTDRGRDGISYLRIPYYNESGAESTYRKRYASKEFRWKYGSAGKICLYGEWRLEEIRRAGYVCLVEGESDSQSMWFMGISCLGVAGASLFKPEQAALLQDLRVYIHVEPDKGGETFLRKVTDGLREGGFIGKAYKWSCSRIGTKDPSDLYLKHGKEEAAKKIRKALEGAEEIDLQELALPTAIEGAPVNLRQPEGWIYSDKGISRIDEKKYQPTLICRTPIILTKRLKSMETGEEKIEVAFKRDGAWHTAIFPRSTVFTARGITALADLGCTITSENAKHVVRFLSALEAENIDIISKADSTGTFGWQTRKRFIPGFDEDIVLDIDASQRPMAAAYCRNGEREKWIELMRPHRARDKFRFILAASFTAPLLRIIKQRIFFVYNWGGSKGGKTAALKAALSAWGDPERLMVNFNATQVGLERTASFFCDLPLGIDERQLAGRNQESLEKTIYMIASGTGKIRGSKGGGLQATHQWRTVALATGEEPLSTETSQTGISTRVLEIYGGPFDDEREASIMHQQSTMHCGHAGPEFVGRLRAMDERTVCDAYDLMTSYVYSVSEGKSGSHIAGISAVALADAMADSFFFQGDADDPPEEECLRQLGIRSVSWRRAKLMAERIMKEQLDAQTGDVNENAVQYIADWILSNRAYFGEKAIGVCYGVIEERWAYIFPSMLNQALQKAGYSPRKTQKYMADNGIIECYTDSGKKRFSVMKWFDNRSCRFIKFDLGRFAKEKDPLVDEEGTAAAIQGTPMGDGFMQIGLDDPDLPFN